MQHPSDSPFAQVGPKLLELGYSPLPIGPGTKAPGQWSADGEWTPMRHWQECCKKQPTAAMIRAWSSWPDCGVGVACGRGLVVIDVDCDEALDAIMKVLPATHVAKTGRKGRSFFYRGDTPKIRSRNLRTPDGVGLLDLLAEGKQSVVPPSIHPTTGEPYFWTSDFTLDEVPLDELPELPDDVADVLAEALKPFGYAPEPETEPARVVSSVILPGQEPTDARGFYRQLNEDALANIAAWAPELQLPKGRFRGRVYKAVAPWRPSGSGRPLPQRNPNLSISPGGIEDFGSSDKFTALDVVMKALGKTEAQRDEAAVWLGERLGYSFAPEIVLPLKKSRREPSTSSGPTATVGTMPPRTHDNDNVKQGARGAHPADAAPFISGQELLAKEFAPMKWVVPDLIPAGLTILASKSKLGKSWMMLLLGLRTVAGGLFLDRQCAAGDALILALEDSERRLQDRLKKLAVAPLVGPQRNLDRITFKTIWRRLDQGGLDDLQTWIDAHPETRLIVIDVWRRVAPPHRAGVMAYNQDYEHLNDIHRLANAKGIAIVLVMHLKKAPSESGDPFDEVMGSAGQVAVADTTLILRKTPDGVTLYARGRDVQETEIAVYFDKDTCEWRSLGDAADLRKAKETNAIVIALREAGREMTVPEIVEKTGLRRETVYVSVGRLENRGEIKKVKRGVYQALDADGRRTEPATPME